MNDLNASTSVASPPVDVYYPGGDNKPMETPIHVLLIVATIGSLRHYFRQRSDIYVIGNIFLYYEEGHPECRRSPDVMIVKGVDAAKYRRSFKTWEERAVPSVIVEFTSRETAEEDQGPKRELYERLGVREYFLFDPLHEYLEQPLMGYRLINGRYEALPAAEDGGLLSSELGLRLVPEETELALIQFRTGERLPNLPELSQALEETRQKAGQAEQHARQAEQHARQAEEHTRQAEQRVGQVEQLARQAEQRVGQAEQLARQAEQRVGQAEQLARQAEQRVGQAEQLARQAEQRVGQAEQRAAQLAEELARLRVLLPPDANGPSLPQEGS